MWFYSRDYIFRHNLLIRISHSCDCFAYRIIWTTESLPFFVVSYYHFYALVSKTSQESYELKLENLGDSGGTISVRADRRFAPSQWETSLQINAVSHWLGTNLESVLQAILCLYSLRRHCLIAYIGIPIINLRRSSDRLRFIMGIPWQGILVNRGPCMPSGKCHSI